jgi:peptide deformylase
LIRDIVKFGDSRLKAPNTNIVDFGQKLSALIDDLVDTCHAAPGVGLAAPQIGVNERVAIIDLSVGKDPSAVVVLVNPVMISEDGVVREEEGCLSIPGISEAVIRPARVCVEASDARGGRRSIEAEGLFARALCHEIDHLESRLFVERLRGLKRELVLKKLSRRGV